MNPWLNAILFSLLALIVFFIAAGIAGGVHGGWIAGVLLFLAAAAELAVPVCTVGFIVSALRRRTSGASIWKR
jgi:hypothetical protein